MSTTVRQGPARAHRPARRDPVVPDQHGAWAFLLLPVALAATRGTYDVGQLPLVLAWVCAYPAAWAATGRLTAPRPQRFDRALRVWAPLAVLAALVSVGWRPWLVWAGCAYAAGFLVSLGYARARRERALGNDLVLVVQCSMMVPVLVAARSPAGWTPPWQVLDAATVLLTVACAVALVGSTLHVKSLIRERGRPGYARASLGFAVAALVATALATAVGVTGAAWLLLPASAAVLRSLVVPGRAWRPARIGLVELGLLVLLAGVAWGL